MLRFTLRRLALVPFVLLGMTFVMFAASQLIPTDPVAAYLGNRFEGGQHPEAEIQRVKERWGWDKPIAVRYVIYLGSLAHGDLGISSSSRRPVIEDLQEYAPATLELVIATLTIALIIAIPLGVFVATQRGRLIDAVFKFVSVLAISAPVFWIGLLAISIFYRDLGWVPASGQLDVFIATPSKVTGLVLADSVLAGDGDAFANAIKHLILPAGLLGTVIGLYLARVVRTEMVDALESDFVRTARGKGLRWRIVLFRHGLRNAIVPVITLSGLAFGALLTSTIVVENVFGWPGLGNYAYRAAVTVDLPGISGVTLVVGTSYLLINLVVDLLYAVVDPRVRVR